MKTILTAILTIVLIYGTCQAADKVLKAVTENWPPYLGAELEDNGPVAEIAKEAFKRAGYDFKIEFVPWNRAVKLSRDGRADLLAGAYYSDERTRFLTYPDKILTEKDVLFAKKERQIQFKDLRDLSGYRIGILRGAVHGKAFDEADFLRKEIVSSRLQNIRKLMADRLDLMAGPKGVVLHEIRNTHPEMLAKIEVLAPPLNENNVYICISKKRADHENLARLFNAKLAEMKTDGAYAAILDRHEVK